MKAVASQDLSRVFTWLGLAVLLVTSIFIRMHSADYYYYNPDEAELTNISSGKTLADVFQFSRYEAHPPVLYILCHYWMKVSTDPAFIRSLSLLFGVLTIILHFKIGELLNGRFTGLCCATLIAFSYGCIIQSYVFRHYMLLIFFLSLQMYFYIKWTRDCKTGDLLAYGGSGLLACMTNFTGMLALACFALHGTYHLWKTKAGMRLAVYWMFVNGAIALPTYALYLYDGPPAQMAQLKPDNGDDPQVKEYTWSLYANPHGYWMVCSYTNTAQRFVRQLNNPQKSCVTKTQDSVQVSLTCQ